MNKRIIRSMSLLIICTVIVFSAFAFVLVGQFDNEIRSGLATLRVTIVDENGDVTFDNQANPDEMDNHLDRPEIAEALEKGTGVSERYSDTLSEITHYYALRLKDGNVIRLAMTTTSSQALLYKFIPIAIAFVLVAIILSFIIARRFANRIIKPINNIDIDNPESELYEELLPFIRKIKTQREEIDRQMSELENRTDTIKAITENMQEGLLLIGKDETVILANRSVSRIFEEDEVVGKNVINVCREPVFIESIKKCLAGEEIDIQMNRSEKIYQVLFDPVEKGDAAGGIAVVFIDITEKFSAEQQRKEFSANVSHELKTPLTTIVAISEMLSQGIVKKEDIPQFGERINVQSKRLLDIIEDIMRLSEFDEDSVNAEYEKFNLYYLAKNVLDNFSERATEKNISLSLSAEKDSSVYMIKRLIEELLSNLIDNAIKYSEDDDTVEVAIQVNDNEIIISVEDSGIGIPKEKVDRIFERFYRIDSSRSKKTGGTGLGLSIVKHIVDLHSGHIDVVSSDQEGTKISCIFKNKPF